MSTDQNTPVLETERLILRRFTPQDAPALLSIHRDREVNTFLPWFPLDTLADAERFYEERYASLYRCPSGYGYAVCLKQDSVPVGYVNLTMDQAHDLGYGLSRAYWGRGIITEACRAVLRLARMDGLPYVTATHDVNNPKSGDVMQRLGMRYCYSYEEHWLPKELTVVFRMYQLDLNGQHLDYPAYWDRSAVRFVEGGLSTCPL